MTAPDAPVRWGLVGFGSGGRIFHAPLLACAAGVELAAVVTTDPARRARATAELGVPCAGSIEDLPALGVRAVTISTPPATHTALARRAVDAGLDVVVDKPFALTAADAAELLAYAERAGRLVIPYQNRRWDGDYLTVARLVAGGGFGTVHRFTSRIDRFRAVKPGWPGGTPQQGAGTLLDLGPHLVDQALHLFGPAESVDAELLTLRPGALAEDDVVIRVRHTGGVRSTLCASMCAAAEGPRFQVNGSAGGYLVGGFDVQESQLKAGGSPADLGAAWGVAAVADHGVLVTAAGRSAVPTERGRWDVFYPATARAVRREGPPPVAATDAVATASVLDAARRSAAIGRPVPLMV